MATYTIDNTKTSINRVDNYSVGKTQAIKIPTTPVLSRMLISSKINSTQDILSMVPFSVEPVSIYDYYYLNQEVLSFDNQETEKSATAGLRIKEGVIKVKSQYPFRN